MSTKDVIDHHLAALGAGDAEEVLADYMDESVVMTMDGQITGLAGIREFFESLLTGLMVPGTYELVVDRLDVAGEVALLLWHGSLESAEVTFAVDTFVVRDGKIATQTFAAKVDPK